MLEPILPSVEFLEISPDSLSTLDDRGRARLQPGVVSDLQSIGHDAGLIVHGVGLSIGSYDGWNDEYIRLLDELVERLTVCWHSEHVGYTRVRGEFLGTMLPLPRTRRAADLVCQRVGRVQERYGLPFLLEHVVGLLPDAPSEFTDAGFLNHIAGSTGCGLVLDVYNLRCDERNRGLDLDAFFAELDARHVFEVHIAGGVLFRGLALDVHSRAPAPETLDVARKVLPSLPSLAAVTYELVEEAVAVIGAERIVTELQRLRTELDLETSLPCATI